MDNMTINEIISGIILAKKELDIATKNFDFAVTEEFIDISTYQIMAAKKKYDYLIRQARENNLNYMDYLTESVSAV